MNLTSELFRFTFLTPCFSGTAEGKEAAYSELRIPPIRGHIRFWHRSAYCGESANRVWGSTNGTEGHSSRVALRIGTGLPPSGQLAQLLPHKSHGQGSRPSMPVGARASIQLQRLPSCTHSDWAEALTSTKLWLLAGTLGYRSNRAAGSVWPTEPWAPRSLTDLADLLGPLIAKACVPWAAALVGAAAHKSWAELREAASATPRGPAHLFGCAQPRTPSPVKFKIASLESGLCLLVLAPSKTLITEAEAKLKNKPDPHRWNELGQWRFL